MNITVLGAGAWGTALAINLAGRHSVVLWDRKSNLISEAEKSRVNHIGLPGFRLPESLQLMSRFDEAAQSPWFRYVDESGQEHEVWFEDARSIRAKLDLARTYGLRGVGYWNLMRPFPQNWAVLNSLYRIREEL